MFVGRADEQVKIRGFRIEPGEVQTVLAAHPALAQAAVTVREDTPGDKRLVAYIVAEHDDNTSGDLAQSVREFAAERLPGYMVPSAFVVLDEMPVTVNGKLDEKSLPAPDHSTVSGRGGGAAGVLEETVCAAFAQVLGLSDVGLEDDFFALGGHSLMAIGLVEQLRVRGVSVSVRDIIGHPTPTGLINTLNLSSVQDALSGVLPIRTQGDKPPLFFVHPGGGLSWSYRPLARHIPEDVPVYGLQADGLDGVTPLSNSVRQMAAAYIERIRAVCPSGPYQLVGWSFGGVVAHEMALQLQAAGVQVAALVLMDAYPFERTADDQGHGTVAGPGQKTDVAQTLEELRAEMGHVLGGLSDEELALLAGVYHNNGYLMSKHEPGRFDGHALLLVAEEGKTASTSHGAKWKPYISGEISEAVLPCNHHDMARPDMLERAWSAMAEWMRTVRP
ncbi:alpha/beta fold hydrolase [Streptomyces shenzhenensis]|uniref:alpha/beta fold hydrolase n=1 Tax=Streptomyces shenzhenensis TaxID=943815 RepID=UPI0027E417F2|nr:alpha/beta fold hydrolase [Streptomyces shenzhenensis]